MIKATYKRFVSVAICLLVFVQQTAFAETAQIPRVATGLLGFQLPHVDRQALVEKVEMLRDQLIERKEVLVRSLDDEKLDSGDVLITAIVPGGLFYAGYRKLRYEQTKEKLARLNAEINEFANDLLAVEAMSGPVAVAQAY